MQAQPIRIRFGLWAVIATVIGLAVWPTLRAAQPTRGEGENKLVGTWTLVAIDERSAQGERVTPLDYGDQPIGLLIYDTTGHMSVHAMRRGRPRLPSEDVHLAPLDLAKAAFVGYGAYFGTYSVDEQAGLVVHHVEGSLIPNWEGGDQRRRFTVIGDKLVLEPPELQARGEKRTRRLTWERVR
jgi:hypothetical protein